MYTFILAIEENNISVLNLFMIGTCSSYLLSNGVLNATNLSVIAVKDLRGHLIHRSGTGGLYEEYDELDP